MDLWIPDTATYNELQKLKEFVHFVARLPQADQKSKTNAEKIIHFIENIHKPESDFSWYASFYIEDGDDVIDDDHPGVYLRVWSVYFERDEITVEVETMHTDTTEHYGDDFYYHGMIILSKDYTGERLYLEDDLQLFVDDAKNYRKYMNEVLNEIDVEIEIF